MDPLDETPHMIGEPAFHRRGDALRLMHAGEV